MKWQHEDRRRHRWITWAATVGFLIFIFKTTVSIRTAFFDIPGGACLHPSSHHLVEVSQAAVACDVPLCSKMGTEILKKGGAAADAAVTVALCIGAINSHSSGIGGGGFIVSKIKDEDAISIDAREMAPEESYKDMFNDNPNAARVGGLAVATPGELKGLYTLFSKHGSGKLTWKELLDPVVDLCFDGWQVSEVFSLAVRGQEELFQKFDPIEWGFLFQNGKLVSKGDWIRRPQLGKTLHAIARNGSDAMFYDPEGPIVEAMVNSVKSHGGILKKSDFGKYQVRVEPALSSKNFTENGYQIFTSHGASAGMALVAGLNLLNQLPTEDAFDMQPLSSHRLIETMKWMSSVRSNLGDVSVYSTNKTEILEHEQRYAQFYDPKWARETSKYIFDNRTLPWQDYHPAYQQNTNHGTAHFSIVDSDGGAVSMTTTVNLLFGSAIHDPVTGVIFNDEMDDFSIPNSPNAFGLEPSIYNYIEPFKRPLSSCAPSIVALEGMPDFVIGAAGGSRITTAILQAITRNYHYGMDMLDIIAFPRLHHQLLPEVVFIEKPEDGVLVSGLEEKGHSVEMISHLTAMNGIKRVGDKWHAVSDFWRKEGEADGY